VAIGYVGRWILCIVVSKGVFTNNSVIYNDFLVSLVHRRRSRFKCSEHYGLKAFPGSRSVLYEDSVDIIGIIASKFFSCFPVLGRLMVRFWVTRV
jgi:hypothetical protein